MSGGGAAAAAAYVVVRHCMEHGCSSPLTASKFFGVLGAFIGIVVFCQVMIYVFRDPED